MGGVATKDKTQLAAEEILIQEFKKFEPTILEALYNHEQSIIKRAKSINADKSKALAFEEVADFPAERTRSFENADVWQNWMGNVKVKPNKILYPTSLEDLKNYVKTAKENGKKIRCAAEGHSWSSLSYTEGYLVVLNKMDKIDVEKRGNEWVVTAEAGAQISKIDKFLRMHDPPLTIESMTVLDNVRIGGVVATGSHGAKTDSRTIVDQVVGLQIVAADGNLHEFSDDKNPEEMSVARVNLGLLGIIYKVSLRVRPMYNLRMIDTYPPMSWLTPSALKDVVQRSDGIELFYWPFNTSSMDSDRVWLKQWTKSPDHTTVNDLQLTFQRIAQTATTKIGNDLYQHLLSTPNVTPTISYWAGKLRLIERNDVLEAPDAIHYQAGIPNIPCDDLEFVIKADEDFGNVVEEFKYVIKRMYEYAKVQNYPLNLVLEMRILKSSSAVLSSAYDKDPEAIYFFIEVLSIKNTPFFKEFSAELAQRWMKKYNAMPHWAKDWEYVPNVTEYLHKLLSERVKRFEAVRVNYDPDKIFFDNKSLQQVFYGN